MVSFFDSEGNRTAERMVIGDRDVSACITVYLLFVIITSMISVLYLGVTRVCRFS